MMRRRLAQRQLVLAAKNLPFARRLWHGVAKPVLRLVLDSHWAIEREIQHYEATFPRILRIEGSNGCNAACWFCPYPSMERTKALMPMPLYQRLIDEFASLGGGDLVFPTGVGEPFADPYLFERLTYARSKREIRKITLITNASLLDAKRTERVLASRVSRLRISFHGGNRQADYEQIFQLPYEKARQNVLRFLEANAKAGCPVEVEIYMYVTDEPGQVRREELVKTFERLGASVGIDPIREIHNWGGDIEAPRTIDQQIKQLPCSRLWREFSVLANGDVVKCCIDYEGKEVLGNVARDSLKAVWDGPTHRDTRDLHRAGRAVEVPLCKTCTLHSTWWKHERD